LKKIILLIGLIVSSSVYSQHYLNTAINWDELMDAVEANDTSIIRTLINEGADINKLYNGRYTPFMYACEEGKLEAVLMMLSLEGDHNVDISAREPICGYTGLILATWKGHKDIIRAILDKCPEQINLRDFRDLSPYDYTNNPEIIEILNEYKKF
jgi:ankyrin repeat protein